MKNLLILLLCSGALSAQDETLKLNQLQAIATHNSYKMALDSGVMAQVMKLDSNQAKSLDYAHPPLRDQLDMGMLGLEIDVLYDPEGGRYAKPYGLIIQKMMGLEAKALDQAVMNRPGFKVLHVQDIDYRSSCPTFIDCLGELNDWSNEHPHHLPIMISINAKEGGIDRPGFTEALPFTDTAFTDLDAEIIAALTVEKLLSPNEVKGDYATLREAVMAGNWPAIESLRGKFFFVLDGGEKQTAVYTQGHPSLDGRVMFAATAPDKEEAAILFMNEPVGNEAEIRDRVGEGFIVRTRADAGTTEARSGDYERLRSAVGSGAHYISTDYEVADERFGHNFKVRLPGEATVRCNPVTKLQNCTDPIKNLE